MSRTKPVKVTRASPRVAARALAQAIAASVKTPGGNPCRTCQLPKVLRVVVDQTLALPPAERNVSLLQLAFRLEQQGYPVGESSLQKHGTKHLGR